MSGVPDMPSLFEPMIQGFTPLPRHSLLWNSSLSPLVSSFQALTTVLFKRLCCSSRLLLVLVLVIYTFISIIFHSFPLIVVLITRLFLFIAFTLYTTLYYDHENPSFAFYNVLPTSSCTCLFGKGSGYRHL